MTSLAALCEPTESMRALAVSIGCRPVALYGMCLPVPIMACQVLWCAVTTWLVLSNCIWHRCSLHAMRNSLALSLRSSADGGSDAAMPDPRPPCRRISARGGDGAAHLGASAHGCHCIRPAGQCCQRQQDHHIGGVSPQQRRRLRLCIGGPACSCLQRLPQQSASRVRGRRR